MKIVDRRVNDFSFADEAGQRLNFAITLELAAPAASHLNGHATCRTIEKMLDEFQKKLVAAKASRISDFFVTMIKNLIWDQREFTEKELGVMLGKYQQYKMHEQGVPLYYELM